MSATHEIAQCRICGNTRLESVLNLGRQYLTGIFPRDREREITCGPLEMVKCHGDSEADHCGLVQLRQSYSLDEMYGDNYGYRSSLNQSMVAHLRAKVNGLREIVTLQPNDLVIDIGSNDGTLLSCYPPGTQTLVGIDPTAAKFRQYYRPDIEVIEDFFSKDTFQARFGERKAKVITSIAMFYDIERPLDFVTQIHSILAEDGVWHLEQSYLPSMLATTAYDTICHEHLEYYALTQILWMIRRVGLKIVTLDINKINGGSFCLTLAKTNAPYPEATGAIEQTLQRERAEGIGDLATYAAFKQRVFQHRTNLLEKLAEIKSAGQTVLGYGASTKGNVILQFCGLTADDLPCIAEVNPDKFGSYTPGTLIPIVSEQEAHARNPDYLLVLPWHFRQNIVQREAEYLKRGGKLLFPLPCIETVGL